CCRGDGQILTPTAMRGEFRHVVDRAGTHGHRHSAVSTERTLNLLDKRVLGVQAVGLQYERLRARSSRRCHGGMDFTTCGGKCIFVSDHDALRIAKQLAEQVANSMPDAGADLQPARVACAPQRDVQNAVVGRRFLTECCHDLNTYDANWLLAGFCDDGSS